jgi:dTDP-4-dehydrorhamnose reductase
MRLLITGAAGMLGTDLCSMLEGHEVLGVDITGDCDRLDITDRIEVQRLMAAYQPDLVLHLAAFTNVDGCQTDPETAWRVNAAGTWNLASASCDLDCGLLYISTDFVFDGTKGSAYDEFDIPNPVSVYGRTKYAGEQFVRHLVRRHYIIRTAWLYGVHGKSFPGTMLRLAREGRPLRVVGDQTGSPTYTRDLAECILRLIEMPLYGVYHVTNSGECSWYDLAAATLELAGMGDADLTRITSEEWPTPTRRPEYSVLEHRALKMAGLPPMRDWRDALADFVAEYRSAQTA